jgi:hypothetical protein
VVILNNDLDFAKNQIKKWIDTAIK